MNGTSTSAPRLPSRVLKNSTVGYRLKAVGSRDHPSSTERAYVPRNCFINTTDSSFVYRTRGPCLPRGHRGGQAGVSLFGYVARLFDDRRYTNNETSYVTDRRPTRAWHL